MTFVQKVPPERMESETVLGWMYTLFGDLESTISSVILQYYSPSAFVVKSINSTSTGQHQATNRDYTTYYHCYIHCTTLIFSYGVPTSLVTLFSQEFN